jgi:7-keto-8-aminopelargonate synthetase-like enzyme
VAEKETTKQHFSGTAVPVRSSRLRFFLTAMHTDQEIETAIDTTVEEMAKLPERLRALKVPH